MPTFHLRGNEGSGSLRIEAVDGGTEYRFIADSRSALRVLFVTLGRWAKKSAHLLASVSAIELRAIQV
jgi:hypothetical protein